jgi:hypothetical protein
MDGPLIVSTQVRVWDLSWETTSFYAKCLKESCSNQAVDIRVLALPLEVFPSFAAYPHFSVCIVGLVVREWFFFSGLGVVRLAFLIRKLGRFILFGLGRETFRREYGT